MIASRYGFLPAHLLHFEPEQKTDVNLKALFQT